ncbi:MAG: winged helix-turn-helix domain-containing protein [Xanthobacteraceae bacterium]
MMPVIRISDATWERLKAHARPFEDKPEDIVNLALDALDEKVGRKQPQPEKEAIIKKTEKRNMLPQKEFRMPLLKTLAELGGSARVSEIRQALEKKIAPLLNEADYEKVSTGEVRWWNAACWERANLVREGLFADDKERGVWKLSIKGKLLAR